MDLSFQVSFLGCFSFSPNRSLNQQPPPPKRRRKLVHPPKSLTLSIRSYLSNLFSFRNKPTRHQPPLTLPESGGKPDISSNTISTKRGSFSSRMEIFPCSACGEVLSESHLLDLHHASKHAFSELHDGESGKNIVGIIFQSGWRGKAPVVHRILRIHNTPRTLARFEEYRELVRSRAARYAGVDERCIVDGNERLRFYCSTTLCALGRDGGGLPSPTGLCGSQFCCTCAIVRLYGFSGKQVEMDNGIASTHATSWNAHVCLPDALEQEFTFLHVRRAMLVCRVIAGRVGGAEEEEEEEEKGVFDSLVVPLRVSGGPRSSWGEDEELLVFNPRAVLPCFIIIYSV